MENTLQRLVKFIDYKGLTIHSFEKKVGFSNGSLASQIKNNKTIGVDKLENILKLFTDLSPNWILTGEGNMIKTERDINFITASRVGAKAVSDNEADFLNKAQEIVKEINFLYQRLVDIRVLLFQELRIKGEFSTKAEMELLNELARPSFESLNDEQHIKYPYENLSPDEKEKYLQQSNACLTLFTNTFFECFRQLYAGIQIPTNKELRHEFMRNRKEATDNFTYTHYLKLYS